MKKKKKREKKPTGPYSENLKLDTAATRSVLT